MSGDIHFYPKFWGHLGDQQDLTPKMGTWKALGFPNFNFISKTVTPGIGSFCSPTTEKKKTRKPLYFWPMLYHCWNLPIKYSFTLFNSPEPNSDNFTWLYSILIILLISKALVTESDIIQQKHLSMTLNIFSQLYQCSKEIIYNTNLDRNTFQVIYMTIKILQVQPDVLKIRKNLQEDVEQCDKT